MEKKKGFWSDTWFGYALKNILIAIAIIVGLVWLTLLFTNFYTKHGQSEKVPDLKGISMNEAIKMLDRHNLKAEVIDSVYVRGKQLGTIIEQNPAPNSIVKPGRPIYIIINSTSVKKVAFPDVRDLSVRQATAMLISLGINVAAVQHIPSEYKDLVIDAKCNGQTLMTGTKIPEGSAIVLIAGSGESEDTMVAPVVKGLDLNSAVQVINNSSLVLGRVIYDVIPNGDDDQYIIYRQNPDAGNSTSAGSIIDVWLSKDRNKKDETVVDTSEKQQQQQNVKKKDKVKDIENFF